MDNVRRTGRRLPLLGLTLAAAVMILSANAWGRSVEDCQEAWGKAARSYRSNKDIKGPEDESFKSACELSLAGKRDAGRVEAATVAIKALGLEDADGCARFAKGYLQVKKPEEVCAAANGDEDALKKLVEEALPPPPWKK